NPRTEDPEKIIRDILGPNQKISSFNGVWIDQKIYVHTDRKTALREALSKSQLDDVVLIAGKGHENYQIVGKEKLHFSDVEEVQKFFEAK
ncbi:MAG: UDP-N-acetylmuramoyl-L-alanyl-D-glutamate--2,6-diaminopimelate ligase, partial [Pseudobdellovibrionaceae bacterium]